MRQFDPKQAYDLEDVDDFDAILADEIREYLKLDDMELAGLGLSREYLEGQLNSMLCPDDERCWHD